MKQLQIPYEQNAIEVVLKQLHKLMDYRFSQILLTNRNRYAVILGDPNIAITLKTEPFYNFGRQFYHLGEKGVGDSINVESIKFFIKNSVKFIYSVFRDGKIYCISMEDFLKNSHRWKCKEGIELRSISIQRYKRVNPPTP